MEYVLTTSTLCKRYGKQSALDGLTMNVPKGAIYGFVGRNGAGKTTLLRLVCGLQRPSSGGYTLYGVSEDDKNISRSRRRMGAVVEAPAIYLDMSAEDNLKQQALLVGLPSYDSVGEKLKLVGLEGAGGKKARNFSLGMKQRLGIAVALMGNPDFLLLDEPTNGLDPQGIIEMRELIIRLNREQGITVLVSSHILSELSKLATHYGFIDKGRMVKEISADELERVSRKCLHIEVSDVTVLPRVLESLGIEYEICSDTGANIYGEAELTTLVYALAKENCKLVSSHSSEESLENYYMNLVGGGENA